MSLETDIETNKTALDLEQSEAEKNQIAFDATREFLKSGIEIKDIFGNLEDFESPATV
jgi:flagellar basal body rod protein FlgB